MVETLALIPAWTRPHLLGLSSSPQSFAPLHGKESAWFAVGFLSPRWGLELFEGSFTQGVALDYFLPTLRAFNSCQLVSTSSRLQN